MTKKERYKLVIDYFKEHQPVAETELDYRTPYELLVANTDLVAHTLSPILQITLLLFFKYINRVPPKGK